MGGAGGASRALHALITLTKPIERKGWRSASVTRGTTCGRWDHPFERD